jgi:DNA repair protein RadA/Sms
MTIWKSLTIKNNGKGQNNFFCQSCGTSYAKWQGQCNACKEWNTIAEEIQNKIKWHGKANLSQSRTKTTKNKMKLTRQKKSEWTQLTPN